MSNNSVWNPLGITATALLLTGLGACGSTSGPNGHDASDDSTSGETGTGGTGGSSAGSGSGADSSSAADDDGDSSSSDSSGSGDAGGSGGSMSSGDSGSDSDSDSTSGSDSDSDSTSGSGSSSGSGSGTSGSTSGGTVTITPIPGGGVNSAPLGDGCSPDTASDCHPKGGDCAGAAFEDYERKTEGVVCFFGPGVEEPSATVEHVTEVVNGQEYVHVRVTFDPNFVDTVYGECSPATGWPARRGHRWTDLVKSDHVELKLFDCGGDLSMHFKLDFITEDPSAPCGYSSLGVSGGDGALFVGDASDVIEATSSLDRNMNGCGYCDTVNSPCTDLTYASDPNAPEWDFRMVYEVWLEPDAFNGEGLCGVDIDYVHASPSKDAEDTILVEPDDCPPGTGGSGGSGGAGGAGGAGGTGGTGGTGGAGGTGGGTGGTGGEECPPNYELILTSEGEYFCEGPPGDDGICPDGYVVDLTSEGERCISAEPVR